MMTTVAERLNIDQVDLRRKNMYKEDDVTHFGFPIHDWFVPDMFETIINECNYKETRAEFDKFNSENVWKKRGVAVMPAKYMTGFGMKHMSQGEAIVHIYLDGSVLINYGGVEMGQGLHTKMIQIAAAILNIPDEQVHIAEAASNLTVNVQPTAASMSSDIYGGAVEQACLELMQNLKPFKDKSPEATLAELAFQAHMERVSLTAKGFNVLPFDSKERYHYATSGVCMSTVELDVLTGDYTILKVDIIMDIGSSLNYSIDIGQIEGAFVQGIGLSTLEEVQAMSSTGAVVTLGPGNYKIPVARSIPQEFNVKILKDKTYKKLRSVRSSKAIGEPPLMFGSSVFFALRDAVNSARLFFLLITFELK
jgi:xanthine dehydrogenase/oxidase